MVFSFSLPPNVAPLVTLRTLPCISGLVPRSFSVLTGDSAEILPEVVSASLAYGVLRQVAVHFEVSGCSVLIFYAHIVR